MVAELAVTDGMPPPAHLPAGEFTALPTGTDDQFTIRRADPRILISGQLLDLIADGGSPHARLDMATCHTYVGSVLKITGINRTVIYRITEFVPRIGGYIGEWPD